MDATNLHHFPGAISSNIVNPQQNHHHLQQQHNSDPSQGSPSLIQIDPRGNNVYANPALRHALADADLLIRDQHGTIRSEIKNQLLQSVQRGELNSFIFLANRANLAPDEPLTEKGTTALWEAAAAGQSIIVSYLLHAGWEPSLVTTEDGRSPLHAALVADNIDDNLRFGVVRDLLIAKADANLPDREGKRPLDNAIDLNCPTPSLAQIAIIRCLLEYGADANYKKDGEDPALHRVMEKSGQWLTIAETLLSFGADVNLEGKRETMPLQCAVHAIYREFQEKDSAETIQRPMPERQAELDQDQGHQANIRLLQCLLAWRANPNYTREGGNAAMHYFSGMGLAGLAYVRLLMQYGAQVDINGRYGFTPMHSAVERFEEAGEWHPELIDALLGGGASMDEPNDDDLTPIQWAENLAETRGHELHSYLWGAKLLQDTDSNN